MEGSYKVAIKYEVVEQIGILSQKANGWRKELNLVSWNDNDAKYDIREWNADHTRMSKGITMTSEEINILCELLKEEVEK